MEIGVIGTTPGFDRADDRNGGLVADELVGPGGGGAMLLFKQRWDIEKVFDQVKNKMLERKSWASGRMAKERHADFICLTHNLMVLLEDEIGETEGVSNTSERARKSRREVAAKKSGASYVATALQRFTVRSVKFVRWLRNFMYCETGWGGALARLAEIYATR